MRRILFLATACVSAGCYSADRPRLLDRLFHRDDDCPSSRAAREPAPCDRNCLGAPTMPVSYGRPVYVGDGVPTSEVPYSPVSPPAGNELPLPGDSRIPATPVPADPNRGVGLGR